VVVEAGSRQPRVRSSFAISKAGPERPSMSSWQLAQPRDLNCSRPRAASTRSTVGGWNAGISSLEMDRRADGIACRANSGPSISNENIGSRPVWK
jgi:hypothetical protein